MGSSHSTAPSAQRHRGDVYSSQCPCRDLLDVVANKWSALAIGALGEVLDYRLCMTVCGLITIAVCWLTVFLRRRQVRQVLADRPGVDQIR